MDVPCFQTGEGSRTPINIVDIRDDKARHTIHYFRQRFPRLYWIIGMYISFSVSQIRAVASTPKLCLIPYAVPSTLISRPAHNILAIDSQQCIRIITLTTSDNSNASGKSTNLHITHFAATTHCIPTQKQTANTNFFRHEQPVGGQSRMKMMRMVSAQHVLRDPRLLHLRMMPPMVPLRSLFNPRSLLSTTSQHASVLHLEM